MSDRHPPLSEVRGRETLQERLYLNLRSALMAGEFTPGDRLTPKAVSAWSNTSIMPAREALRRLTTEGALESLPNGSTRVPILSARTLREITELRLLIEPYAAKKAARNTTRAVIEQLRAEHEALLDAVKQGDAKREAKANERFHFLVYRAADSAELLHAIETLWLRVGPALLVVLHKRNNEQKHMERRYISHHTDLIDALQNKRGNAAAAAVKADLKAGATVLLES